MNIFKKSPLIISMLFIIAILKSQISVASCDTQLFKEKYPELYNRPLIIGQDGESPPFSMRESQNFDQLIGLDADMARSVFQCLGIPIEFKVGKWSGLIPAVMNNKIDVMWDQLLYTPERAQNMTFVGYMKSATGVLVQKGNPQQLKKIDQLCGHKVAVLLGTTQEALLKESNLECIQQQQPEINIVTTADIPSGLRLVQNQRADALLGNSFLIHHMSTSMPGVEEAFNLTTGAILAVGVAKGQDQLTSAIAEGLQDIIKNGTLATIYRKYDIDYNLAFDKPKILTQ